MNNEETENLAPQESRPESSSDDKRNLIVVGIGASAGGVTALREFFGRMSPDSGMAFVVVLHLSPQYESNLAAILQSQTAMPVTQVTETVKVQANQVYVIPPNKNLAMEDGTITLTQPEPTQGQRVAIDLFFRTLAEAYGRNSICIILSGMGSDGTLGLKRIKESNGFAIVQAPENAEYDGMPRSAISTGLVDWVLPVAEMPVKLISFRDSSERLHLTELDAKTPVELKGADDLREILTLLRVRTGHDFTHYKQPTLLRRIARHLQIHELEDIPTYLTLLRERPDEIQSLLKNLLINVTNFFRDKEAFEALEQEVIPQLFANKTGKDAVRVWAAGCASGEEAYSLGILLAEYANRLTDPPKIQVFGTDVDEDAIAEARDHNFPETIEADVSPDRLRRFFIKEGNFYRVRKDLRELILFAPHNVLRDPPFSRLDLITCRNLLIYLNRDTQERLLEIFHFALKPNGFLFLGNSESAESQGTLFMPFDKKNWIYSRRTVATHLLHKTTPLLPLKGDWQIKIPEPHKSYERENLLSFGELHYKLVEQYAPPSILVNEEFEIVHLSDSAGRYLRFTGGEPTNNLFKVIHPELLADLRAALFSTQREGKASEFQNIRIDLEGKPVYINLVVRQVDMADAGPNYLLIIFDESSTPTTQPKQEEQSTQILDKDDAIETVIRRLEDDLRRTRDRLRTTIEQHETSIEELKASNEELQAINEELRSASEELETSKEELQSVNEELTTVNHELKDKVDEISRTNSDLQNLMSSTDIGTMFLDRGLRIKRYTPSLQRLFNIIPTDVGRPLEHLTHKLEYEELISDATEVMRTLKPSEREIYDRNQCCYLARILPYRTIDDKIEGVVLTFIDINERIRAEANLRQSEESLKIALQVGKLGSWQLNLKTRTLEVNETGQMLFGFRPKVQLTYESWLAAIYPDDRERAQREMERAIQIHGEYESEYRVVWPSGEVHWITVQGRVVSQSAESQFRLIGITQDITERKRRQMNAELLAGLGVDFARLSNTQEILEVVSEKIGHYLEAHHCSFSEIDKTSQVAHVRTDWHLPGMVSLVGTYQLADWITEGLRQELAEGHNVAVNDVTEDPRTAPFAENFASLQIGSFIHAPSGTDGHWNCLLSVTRRKPSIWRADEIELMGDLATMVWLRLERARAVEKLEASEKRLRLTTEAAQMFMTEYHVQTGELTTSDNAEQVLGFPPPADQAANLALTHPEDRETSQQQLQQAMTNNTSYQGEVRLINPNTGQIVWQRIQGLLIDPEHFVSLSQNVTEHKLREEERRQLEIQIQSAQKLESLGVLAGGIAHDFNNLLTGILGYCDLARSSLSAGSAATRFLDEVVNGSRRAAELIQQMLAYAGKGQFVLQALNLSDLVVEMGRLLEVSISKKCVLHYNFTPNLPACKADKTQMRQVIMNLIINASEAIGDQGGVITVSTGVMYCDRAYLSRGYLDDHLPEGNYVYLEVLDTGCGMNEETRAKLFDPFFTTKFTGRGLGLAAVLGIVRSHGGTISVTSELGAGTTVTVHFPVTTGPVLPETTPTGDGSSWKGQGLVLLIDDQESVRKLTSEMMVFMGFKVLFAADGREGVEVFRREHEKLRLVLLDMTMPQLDGAETFLEMQRIRPGVPTVLLSGYSEQVVQTRFAGTELAGFIQKPFEYHQLVAVVRKALGEASEPN
ncbi:MAG: PAS domain-containing protein [Blastocatellia bacterium]|nr:PAS domain-containing protein [Blastocatellia bacterium]